jgi:hypothetical protein
VLPDEIRPSPQGRGLPASRTRRCSGGKKINPPGEAERAHYWFYYVVYTVIINPEVARVLLWLLKWVWVFQNLSIRTPSTHTQNEYSKRPGVLRVWLSVVTPPCCPHLHGVVRYGGRVWKLWQLPHLKLQNIPKFWSKLVQIWSKKHIKVLKKPWTPKRPILLTQASTGSPVLYSLSEYEY